MLWGVRSGVRRRPLDQRAAGEMSVGALEIAKQARCGGTSCSAQDLEEPAGRQGPLAAGLDTPLQPGGCLLR
jgi:hypothetical protein